MAYMEDIKVSKELPDLFKPRVLANGGIKFAGLWSREPSSGASKLGYKL
jgi:hypothetical protein